MFSKNINVWESGKFTRATCNIGHFDKVSRRMRHQSELPAFCGEIFLTEITKIFKRKTVELLTFDLLGIFESTVDTDGVHPVPTKAQQ